MQIFCFFCFFLFFFSLNVFPKRTFCVCAKQWTPSFRSDFTLPLSLNKAVNTLCYLKYNPLLWHCPTSIKHCATNSISILISMTPSLSSLSFLRLSKCAQRQHSGAIMFIKFYFAFISDLSEKISFFLPASDKIFSK